MVERPSTAFEALCLGQSWDACTEKGGNKLEAERGGREF